MKFTPRLKRNPILQAFVFSIGLLCLPAVIDALGVDSQPHSSGNVRGP